MKIVVIGANEGMGGAQTAYRELLSFLVRRGAEVGAISIADKNEPINLELVFQTQVESSRSLQKIASSVAAFLSVRRFRPKFLISVGLSDVGCLLACGAGSK